jgi:3'-phosphoadenosine 5'-phosphosulfate sulfotransferase (PAPS reductase)/FAD synthetase
MDEELLLADRLGVIKTANEKYDLEHNAYLSFSGGKDSTILHHLLDMALPNNNIPRVYIDTGIEYNAIRKFVMKLAEKDKRFVIIKPSKPIKQTLEKYGYPFKSKAHSHNVGIYQHGGLSRAVMVYLGREKTKTGKEAVLNRCPKSLEYQFTPDFKVKCSDQCCLRLKKMPIHKWESENNRRIAITGMRKEEGGQRANIKGCILTDKEGRLKKFHPLLVVSDDWEEWFIEKEQIELCELYYPPFNFKRTGCKGCPFSIDLQSQLSVMEIYLPQERKQCEIIWKPVYDEYRRIGYRLNKTEQMKLF